MSKGEVRKAWLARPDVQEKWRIYKLEWTRAKRRLIKIGEVEGEDDLLPVALLPNDIRPDESYGHYRRRMGYE